VLWESVESRTRTHQKINIYIEGFILKITNKKINEVAKRKDKPYWLEGKEATGPLKPCLRCMVLEVNLSP